MKPATVFLGEMTNPEVETFLKTHETVIIPTGATEQHGPHGPLATDVLIPNEIARRVAPSIGAVVAPPLAYTLSYPHVGFTGMVHIRIPTFMSLIEDLCASFAASGFRRIVFLNGHYDNTYAIAYACATAAERMPKGTKAFPVNYWDALTEAEVAEFSGLKNGLHANLAETSAVMAINPDLVDLDKAARRVPALPGLHGAEHRRRALGVLLQQPRFGALGDEVGDMGRSEEGDSRNRRTLPAGRRPLHPRAPRQHRAHVRGDAAAVRSRQYRSQ